MAVISNGSGKKTASKKVVQRPAPPKRPKVSQSRKSPRRSPQDLMQQAPRVPEIQSAPQVPQIQQPAPRYSGSKNEAVMGMANKTIKKILEPLSASARAPRRSPQEMMQQGTISGPAMAPAPNPWNLMQQAPDTRSIRPGGRSPQELTRRAPAFGSIPGELERVNPYEMMRQAPYTATSAGGLPTSQQYAAGKEQQARDERRKILEAHGAEYDVPPGREADALKQAATAKGLSQPDMAWAGRYTLGAILQGVLPTTMSNDMQGFLKAQTGDAFTDVDMGMMGYRWTTDKSGNSFWSLDPGGAPTSSADVDGYSGGYGGGGYGSYGSGGKYTGRSSYYAGNANGLINWRI